MYEMSTYSSDVNNIIIFTYTDLFTYDIELLRTKLSFCTYWADFNFSVEIFICIKMCWCSAA